MAGATMNNPPLAFNPFAYRPQTYANFSPASLYVSPLEDYTAADLTSDSAPSPGSPVSPMFAAPYALPMDNDWLSWGDKASNNAFVRPNDPCDSPILSSVPARSVSVSPAINPLDLTNNGVVPDDIVPFGQDGLNDNIPLFQTAPIVSSRQQQQPQTVIAPAQIQIKQEPQQQQPEPRRSARASQQQQQQQRKLKRKSTASSASSRSSASPPPAASRRKDAACTSASPPTGNGVLGPKKTAHNMIEKRYRTNLNDKIAALRDAVPALRVMLNNKDQDDDAELCDAQVIKREGSLEDQGGEDLGGLAPAHKLNKATILSKATEYISHLERKNQALADENASLKGRVEGFEMMMMSRGDERDCLWA